ncbi:DUF2914 domain-containing protein [bacterium]|nr:DUF2914 domain-containing protein [bacterium]
MKRILCFLVSLLVILFVGSIFCFAQTEGSDTSTDALKVIKPAEPVEKKAEIIKEPGLELVIDGAQVGTGVEERVIIGEATSFPSSVEKVYCLSFIKGADTLTTVNHVWYYQDKQMASVGLDVKSPAFRTWSYKTILPEWIGSWRVEIVDAGGEVLKIIGFEITESERPVVEGQVIKESTGVKEPAKIAEEEGSKIE